MNFLNTLFGFLNFLQLRQLNRRLAGPAVVNITQEPSLLGGPYEAGRIQGPPPAPEGSWTTADEREWKARLSDPALSKEQRGALLNNYFAAAAMAMMRETSPETIRQVIRKREEVEARQEQEAADAAIRALEIKFNS